MKIKSWLVILICLLNASLSFSQDTDKMMIVIIDGARYSETFGDATHQYVPEMWALSEQGAMIDNFRNDGITYTSRAIPALWCGAWTDVIDTVYNGSWTSYAKEPTIFEYYRKDKNAPAEDCFYVLPYIESLWLPSFDQDYGPDYWPEFHSIGNDDNNVAGQTEQVMEEYHPHFLWVYLADVDHAGHNGNWAEYTNAIQNADQIVAQLWEKIQSDPFYMNTTTMIVSNDHGRHDDQHGGFENHGCGCEGCRHIMFLALGPDIKTNYSSFLPAFLPDMAVTASAILGINPVQATGTVVTDILKPNAVYEQNEIEGNFHLFNVPNPCISETTIHYQIGEPSEVMLSIYNQDGQKIQTLVNKYLLAGEQSILWDCKTANGLMVSPGVYYISIKAGNNSQSMKMVRVEE